MYRFCDLTGDYDYKGVRRLQIKRDRFWDLTENCNG